MKVLALLIGLAIAVLGVAAFVSPVILTAVAREFATKQGLYVAAVIRLGVGALLFGVASRSRSPIGLCVIGAFVFLAGLVTPLISVDRARDYIAWWSTRSALATRLWSLVTIALGLFIAWAVLPVRDRLRPRLAG